MSFILDALKKSESDRQRQSGPSLFEVKVAPPRRRLPIWAVAIAVLLGINVIVISWMLLRHPAASQPAAAALSQASPPTVAPHHDTIEAAPADRATTPPPAQAPESSGPAKGTAQSTAPVTAPPPAAGGGAQTVNPPPAGDNPSDYAPAVEPAAPAGPAGSGAETGDLPLYQQIVGSDGLPALHLDLHVFADRPKNRFVMINMHRLGEGDSLPSGVHVDAIRPDGAVLSYRGTQFLLPRN
ncbi:MAG TPA: general secretion pathway protein GspB [Steroidobacteraceae bacterium]|jgi:general secretion pathway protein B